MWRCVNGSFIFLYIPTLCPKIITLPMAFLQSQSMVVFFADFVWNTFISVFVDTSLKVLQFATKGCNMPEVVNKSWEDTNAPPEKNVMQIQSLTHARTHKHIHI